MGLERRGLSIWSGFSWVDSIPIGVYYMSIQEVRKSGFYVCQGRRRCENNGWECGWGGVKSEA